MTPPAAPSASASTASARSARDALGHVRSGDIFPRYATYVDEPNDALFMHAARGSLSSAPAARKSAKKRLTSASGTCLRTAASACCSAVVPSAYTRKRYPAVFVDPEFTMSASSAAVGIRAAGTGGDPDGAGIGPYVGTAKATVSISAYSMFASTR